MREDNNKPEVIDPDDPRYKDDDYFKSTPSENRQSRFENERGFKYYYFGGCFPLGCGCLPVIAIIALLITWLLSLIN